MGETVPLPGPVDGYTALYFKDQERWRTMRRSDDGWHLDAGGTDPAFASLLVEGDAMVYDDWTRSVYDGVYDK